MKNIVGVDCTGNGNIEYFLTENFHLKKNVTVVVENEEKLQFGKVITEEHPIDENKLDKPLGKIVRIATKKDYQKYKTNEKDAQEALKKCKKLVEKYQLNLNLLDARYTFDRDQLIFRFFSESRVDFRELAKELASIYRVRIELRQIGVRDKAKEVGGVGTCGQELCCHRFLKDFDSVSISMAKNQNLALSPNKINGCCGRLLCCLKYEDDVYKECRKDLPKVGEKVTIKEGTGNVVDINILERKYVVHIDGIGNIEVSNGNN